MPSESQNNAMAEIALALAMGFFSIMVLTMVSMGAGMGESKSAVEINPDGFSIQASASPKEEHAQASRTKTAPADSIIIYHQGRFLNADLQQVLPQDINKDRETFLVLDPDLPMTEAIAVRNRLPVKNLIVTTLDERWLKALKEMPK